MAIPLVVAVGDGTAEALIAGLRQQMAAMRVGPGSDNRNDMGPLVTQQHYQKVKGYIDQGVAEGAELLVDGRELSVIGADGRPSRVFPRPDAVRSRDARHAHLSGGDLRPGARRGARGVAAGGDGPDRRPRIRQRHLSVYPRRRSGALLQPHPVGMVGINVALPVPVAYHSFGGWKRSLFGDLHAYGPDAVRFYTKRKTVTQRWPASGDARRASFSFPSGQG